MKKDTQELFESAPIPKAFLALTVPTVLSKAVMILYNLVDTWFIAATNNTALVAAVSLCLPVLTALAAIGDVWGVGGSSLISRLFGQGEREKARQASALCFYGALLCGIAAAAVMLGWEEPILRLLGADAVTMSYAREYYRITALGAPAIVLCVVPMHLLRTEGLAKESMLGSALGAVIHIVLVPVLMFWLNMGIAGAAWATVWGYAANLLLYLWYMVRKCQLSTISIRAFRPRREAVFPVLSIGIPSSLTTLMQSVALTLTNRYLLLYGTEQVAAFGIAIKLVTMASMVQVGFSFGAQPLIGYNYAKTDHTRLKGILKFNYSFMSVISLAAAAVLWIFAPQLMAIFMEDPAIVTAGTLMTRYQLVGLVFAGIILVSTAVFRAAGKPVESLLLAVSRQGIVYAVVIVAANALFGYQGILAAQPVADVITTVIAIVLLRRVRKD